MKLQKIASHLSLLFFFALTDPLYAQFDIYVANSSDVLKVDASGNVTTFISDLNAANDIAVDRNGFFYVSENVPNTITKYSPDGTSLGVFANLGSDGTVGVDVDEFGNVFVAGDGGSKVSKFDSSGNLLSVFSVTLNPSDVIIDSNNNVYVSDSNADEVWRYDNDGLNGELFTSLQRAAYLTFGPNENLLVSQSTLDQVSEVDSNGTGLGVFASGGLQNASAIAFDPFGNLYVGDNSLNNIRKFSPTGQDLGVFATGVNVPIGMVAVSTVPEPGGLAFLAIATLVTSIRRSRSL